MISSKKPFVGLLLEFKAQEVLHPLPHYEAKPLVLGGLSLRALSSESCLSLLPFTLGCKAQEL